MRFSILNRDGQSKIIEETVHPFRRSWRREPSNSRLEGNPALRLIPFEMKTMLICVICLSYKQTINDKSSSNPKSFLDKPSHRTTFLDREPSSDRIGLELEHSLFNGIVSYIRIFYLVLINNVEVEWYYLYWFFIDSQRFLVSGFNRDIIQQSRLKIYNNLKKYQQKYKNCQDWPLH